MLIMKNRNRMQNKTKMRSICRKSGGWQTRAARFQRKMQRKEDKKMEDNRNELQETESREEQEDAKENESKSEKFIRLAQGRVTKARMAISRLAYLSNSSTYEYTPEQVEQMFSALEEELTQVRAKFQKTEKTKKEFSFQ